MKTTRLEAFSDGVLAIVITIMVLELKVPEGPSLEAMKPLANTLLSYLLSFIYVGIYWNNHHHMLHLCHKVTGRILWANLHVLFWLTLIPFVTKWLGESHFASLPVAMYGVVMLLAAVGYMTLQRSIIHAEGPNSALAKAVGKDIKGKISPAIYLLAILTSLWSAPIAMALYWVVAVIWVIPDTRIEHMVHSEHSEHAEHSEK